MEGDEDVSGANSICTVLLRSCGLHAVYQHVKVPQRGALKQETGLLMAT